MVRFASSGVFREFSGICRGLVLLCAVVFASAGYGQHNFNQTAAGTYDSNDNANWNTSRPTNDGQDVNFTQTINSGDQLVTNFFSAGGGSLNYIRLAPGGTSGLTVISAGGLQSQYGLQLNARATLVLNGGNSTFSFGNNSFDNANGTLVLSNGATLFVNIGANAVQNQGTIQLTAASGGTVDFNYGQSSGGAFNNSGTGTIVKSDTGTGRFTGLFGGNNISFVNNGTIIVNSGTLIVNPANAFDNDGFNNASGGRVFINSGATFVIDRAGTAWEGDSEPDNDGHIFLNGGTLTLQYNGSQASDRGIQNNGTISGAGTLALRILQSATGLTVASNGVLNLFQTVAGNQQTFTSVGGAFGTFRAKSGGTLRLNGNVASGMGGSWLVDNGGTLEINGVNVDLGNAFMPGSQLNGTIRVTTGGNLTLAAAAGPTFSQSGTFDFAGGTVLLANSNSLAAFTNTGTFLLSSGNGTFQTGHGSGQNNYGLVNTGVILASGGGSLTLRSENAYFNAFSNATSGTIIVSNGSHLTFQRTVDAWNAGPTNVVNAGHLILNNGTIVTMDDAGNVSTQTIRNAGTITLVANSTNFWRSSLQNAGRIAMTNASAITQTGSLLINQAGGIISNVNGRYTMVGTVTNAGYIVLNNGTFRVDGSTLFLANGGSIAGSGTLGGALTVQAGGTLTALGGTLTVTNTGAFSNAGNLDLPAGGTLLLTNTAAGTGLTFSNAGAILMRGGALVAGTITNAGQIAGTGTIEGGGVFNTGTLLASNLTANAGTLTARLSSFTNLATATLGVLGTNAVLDLFTPGNTPFLINLGTINLSGGRITNSLASGFTITNQNVIAGVGDLSSLPVVNTTTASIIAQNPVQGLSNFIATVSVTNSAVLGANNIGGAATLTLTVGNGAQGLVNNATIAVAGGFLTLNGGASSITNNTGQIVGHGGQTFRVANLAGGTIVASNGVLQLGLEGNANAGRLSNFNASSSLRLTNSIVVNTGTISLNGGGLYLTGSTITNSGLLSGPGDSPAALVNTAAGTVLATNGTLHLATNASEFVENAGVFLIANGATLNVGPAAWNNLAGGLISNVLGGVITRAAGAGTLTNAGVIANWGTFDLRVQNTGAITNTGGWFMQSLTNSGVIVSSGGTFTGGTFANLGGTFTATNSTVTLLHTAAQNTGTIVAGPVNAIVITNLAVNFANSGTLRVGGTGTLDGGAAFYIMRQSGGSGDFTNAVGGVIQGAGYFRTATFVTGDRNFTIWNAGTILATNGALVLQPGDAFANGGFVNLGGTVTVASASTFAIQRTDNAWGSSGTVPINTGLIELNSGTFVYYGNSLAIANDRALSNAVGGTIRGAGTLWVSLNNQGAVIATNGALFLNNAAATTQNGTITVANGATFTILGSAGSLQNNGNILLAGGTFVATNFVTAGIRNTGTIAGAGTVTFGRTSGTGGANQHLVNTGHIIASNGTLFISVGDAFAEGGFSNSANLRVENGATLAVNRTANAWNGFGANPKNLGTITLAGGALELYSDGTLAPARYLDNVNGTITGQGTISGSLTNLAAATIRASGGTLTLAGTGVFRQAGTLSVDAGATLVVSNAADGAKSFANTGTIALDGGALLAGTVTNSNWIYGSGGISNAVVSTGNSFLMSSNGPLIISLGSFTNHSTGTMGTLTTNAVLDLQLPGGVAQPLLNLGSINMSGGTLLIGGGTAGSISNQATGVIVGVGNIQQTIVNNGTIMAANPVSGLSVFSVGLEEFNESTGTLGASNSATLNVVVSGGSKTTFANLGSITMLGGTLIISNGNFGTITNNNIISGVGTIAPAIHNSGTVAATVNSGVLDVRLLGGTNTLAGRLLAGLGATLQVEDNLLNLGIIGPNGANGGTIQMAQASGTITNAGTILGINGLTFNSFVHNSPGGTIFATNGTVTFNAVNGLANQGVIVVSNAATFQSNSSNAWANAGTLQMRGGTLRTGGFTNLAVSAIFTNSGTIDGVGTIIAGGGYGGSGSGYDEPFVNTGTIVATNPLSSAAGTLFIDSGVATGLDGIRNVGSMVIASNNTLSLNRAAGLPLFNLGVITINNGILTGSGVLSNNSGGIIQGYGTLTHQIVNASGGTIRATNGLLTMTSSIDPVNAGTLEVHNGATMTWNVSNAWANVGTIDLRGGTLRTGGHTNALFGESFSNVNYIVGYGTLIGGGAFNTNGTGFDKAVLNYGTVVATNGTLTIDTGFATTNHGLANFGTMIVAGPSDVLNLQRRAEISGAPGFITNLNYLLNSGRIFIRGGTLTSGTGVTNQYQSASLPGLIQGHGVFAYTNELVNLGTIRATNGVLTIYNVPTGASSINLRQSGTLVVESGSELVLGVNSNSVLANAGTIMLRGGVLRSGTLTNQLAAQFSGFGTITAPTLINSGTGMATSLSQVLHLTGSTLLNTSTGVLGANNGRLVVDAIFTNAGTVSFLNSRGTFNAAVVNQNAWIIDPSTLTFNADMTVESNGYLTMTAGDVSLFKSNFLNFSSRSNDFDTLNGKFIFDGQGGHTQVYGVAGINLGGYNSSLQSSNEYWETINGVLVSTNSFTFHGADYFGGYTNNFALGTLEVGGLNTTSTLQLVDSWSDLFANSDGRVAGLYVDTLTINPGSLLIISNNVQLFFKRTNGVAGVSFGTLDPGSSVLLLNGASFHQINVVPEPSILLLVVLGAAGIYYRRRRRPPAA